MTLIFSLERHREVAEAYVRGLQRLVESGGDLDQDRLGRLLLRVARRHRGRQAARRDRRARRAQGQAGDRQRQAGLPDLQGDLLRLRLGGAGRQGRDPAALPVGVDLDQEPRVPRRPLRRGADRPRHGQHDAARDDRGGPGPRRGPRRHDRGGRRGRPQGVRGPQGRRASTTTTSSPCSRRRASRSSPSPSRSCSPTSSPSATGWWRHERAGPAAPRRLGPLLRRRQLRPPDVVDVGGRPDGGADGEAPPPRLPEPGEPEQRPPDLLQGPRVAAVLRDAQGRGGDLRRGPALVPQVRVEVRGPPGPGASRGSTWPPARSARACRSRSAWRWRARSSTACPTACGACAATPRWPRARCGRRSSTPPSPASTT